MKGRSVDGRLRRKGEHHCFDKLPPTLNVFWSLGIFFVSGFAALVYQVIWQRLLIIFSGADVHSATLVVGAFMAGLGFGGVAGGRIADRLSPQASLIMFAAAEVAVAAFGLASRTLFYDLLYQRLGPLDLGVAATAFILVAALVWPTFFMGMSLPLLARGLTRSLRQAAPTVGWLYGFNTIGAAVGALSATWVVIPQVGLDGGLRLAAMLNLACALATVPMTFVVPKFVAAREGARPLAFAHSGTDTRTIDSSGQLPRTLLPWLALCAAAGFLGLSLEIVWFRILGVMVKSTAFTFGTLLGIYLLGLGVGGVIGGLAVIWLKRPVAGFLTLQAVSGIYAVVALMVFVVGASDHGMWPWFADYFARHDGIDVRSAVSNWLGVSTTSEADKETFVWLYVWLPLALVGPASFLAGASFPFLQRIVHDDLAQLGGRLGLLLAANIVGSTLGAFVTGWVLLDVLGSAGTLKALVVVATGFGAAALDRIVRRRQPILRYATLASTAAIVLALVIAMPDQALLWARLHGTSQSGIIFSEDRSGVSVLTAEHADFKTARVFVNGLHQSWIPYGEIHTVLGALPAFIHSRPRTAAVIGLGSGDTLYALAGRRELERITAIEIVRPQLVTLRELMRRTQYAGLMAILADPRIDYVAGDGRLHIRRNRQQFDIIEADALRPASAYSGNLYSDAYYQLVREHLAPGGLAVTWAPTPRVQRTFVTVFPYVWQHGDVMLGSSEPIRIDRDGIYEQLNDPDVRNYYDWAGVDIVRLLRRYLSGGQSFDPSYDRTGLADINTDLSPRDEFDIPAVLELPSWIN